MKATSSDLFEYFSLLWVLVFHGAWCLVLVVL